MSNAVMVFTIQFVNPYQNNEVIYSYYKYSNSHVTLVLYSICLPHAERENSLWHYGYQ